MRNIRIFLNEYPQSIEIANEIEDRFKNVGITTTLTDINGRVVNNDHFDLNIVVGGDGSFLRAIKLSNFSSSPFIGVNTGSLGFFQEIDVSDIPQFIHSVVAKDYWTSPLRLLKCTAYRNDGVGEEFLCVNEALVKGVNSKVLHMDVHISGHFLESFSGDGMIISTAIGSTAYNYSVGGAIVYPAYEIIELSPLAPISSASYRSLLNSIVMPGRFEVELYPETKYDKEILIVQDGEEHMVRDIKYITVTMSNVYIYRLHIKDDNYWSNLREKFI
ncbi:MAG: NAD(+)/NADH kinase [Ezakiella sp.]|nr:NAD(+)/NADH kinase [Ezakiella sp.]